MPETALGELIKQSSPDFRVQPRYSGDGDFVSIFLKDCEFYAHRVDEVLTVYCEEGTDEMIGCKIKSVTHLLRQLGGDFCVTVADLSTTGKVKLRIVFAMVANLGDPTQKQKYSELARKVGDAEIDMRTVPTIAG